MSTYRYLSNVVLSTLQQKFSDRKITFDQVNYWVQVVSNRLIYQRLAKREANTGRYLVSFYGVEVTVTQNRKYITLPAPIVDLEEDMGIDYITYPADVNDNCDLPLGEVTFERCMPHEVKSLYALPIRKPSPSQPFFCREGNVLRLLGLELISVPTLDIGIHMLISPANMLNIDNESLLDLTQEAVLIPQVISLCRFGFLIPQERELNASDDTATGKNNTALASVPISEQQPQQQPEQQ